VMMIWAARAAWQCYAIHHMSDKNSTSKVTPLMIHSIPLPVGHPRGHCDCRCNVTHSRHHCHSLKNVLHSAHNLTQRSS
jgi:hypothetical protein